MERNLFLSVTAKKVKERSHGFFGNNSFKALVYDHFGRVPFYQPTTNYETCNGTHWKVAVVACHWRLIRILTDLESNRLSRTRKQFARLVTNIYYTCFI